MTGSVVERLRLYVRSELNLLYRAIGAISVAAGKRTPTEQALITATRATARQERRQARRAPPNTVASNVFTDEGPGFRLRVPQVYDLSAHPLGPRYFFRPGDGRAQ